MLDVVELGELAAGVGRDELVKLGEGLAPEIGAVDEEEDAARAGVFDEAIGERAGGESLAGAGGHLDQGARLILGEGFFEVGDGFDVANPHSLHWIRMREWHFGQARARGCRVLSSHSASVSGRWKAKTRRERGSDRVRRGKRFRRRWIRKGRAAGRWPMAEEIGKARAVMGGLLGDHGERCADFFGLDDADGLAIHEEQVITSARLERDFAQGDAAPAEKSNAL